MIHVIAVITAKPGQREAVLKLFRANVPAVRAEDGCIEYTPVVDVPGFGAPHMRAYGEASRDMIASRAVHVLEEA